MQILTTLAAFDPPPNNGQRPDIGPVGIIVPLVVLAILLFCVINWIRMLIHVLRHKDIEARWLWFGIVLLVPLVGWITYLYMVKKPYDAGDDSVRN